MTPKISPLLLLLHIMLIAGCSKPSVEPYATYEVFRREGTNRLVKLVATDDDYHCKKGDIITIRLQHIGPSRKFLSWAAAATNLGTRNLEQDYSTQRNIPLSKKHTFTANISGTFAITFMTFLGRRNTPMKTHKEWDSIQTEGKIILVVEE